MGTMLLRSGLDVDGVACSRERLQFELFPSIERRVKLTGMFGELGSPTLPNVPPQYLVHSEAMSRYMTVSLDRACIVVRRVWLEELPDHELAICGDVEPLDAFVAGRMYMNARSYLKVRPRKLVSMENDLAEVVTFDAVPV